MRPADRQVVAARSLPANRERWQLIITGLPGVRYSLSRSRDRRSPTSWRKRRSAHTERPHFSLGAHSFSFEILFLLYSTNGSSISFSFLPFLLSFLFFSLRLRYSVSAPFDSIRRRFLMIFACHLPPFSFQCDR